ncbi:hypothetical protein BDN72DRAFT_860779 [Pluteus cervinus]|uniref:Uncharacterized protein n=1 Tax=Pluteus cervinus TaxID=181527 RepID=A0ACD3AI81_9AGAR|nr:hypothetical protein BDN72DRAFT_860779 [Pluteus cervinus]
MFRQPLLSHNPFLSTSTVGEDIGATPYGTNGAITTTPTTQWPSFSDWIRDDQQRLSSPLHSHFQSLTPTPAGTRRHPAPGHYPAIYPRLQNPNDSNLHSTDSNDSGFGVVGVYMATRCDNDDDSNGNTYTTTIVVNHGGLDATQHHDLFKTYHHPSPLPNNGSEPLSSALPHWLLLFLLPLIGL